MLKTKNFRAFASLAFVALFCISASGQSIVTNTNDSGSGSLRAALTSGGAIDFDPGLFATQQTITLTTPFSSTRTGFSINGPGAELLTINGTFSSDEIFFIQGGVVNMSGFTLSGANNAPTTNDLTNGIFLRGNLTLENVVVTDFPGSGVFNQVGSLSVNNSTIANNGEAGVFVQGASLGGTATVTNSTVANNGMNGLLVQSGSATVHNSTIAGNADYGVFVDVLGSATINSSIVADNFIEDFFAIGTPTITANSSLIETTSLVANGVSGNIVGVDPLLESLGDNGGQTPTFLLSPGSAAIDAGFNSLGLALDQLGATRVVGSQIDIGATEFVPVAVPEPGSLGFIYAIGLAFVARRNKHTV